MRCLASAMVLTLGLASAAFAQSPSEVTVVVGETVTFALPRQMQIVDVEDRSIATLEVLPDGRARVTGRREGQTRIVGRDHAQVPLIIGVKVTAPPPPPPPPAR